MSLALWMDFWALTDWSGLGLDEGGWQAPVVWGQLPPVPAWVDEDIWPSQGQEEIPWQPPGPWGSPSPASPWVETEQLAPAWLTDEPWQPSVPWSLPAPTPAWIDEDVWPVQGDDEEGWQPPRPWSSGVAALVGDTDGVAPLLLTIVDDDGWQGAAVWRDAPPPGRWDSDDLPALLTAVEADAWTPPQLWAPGPLPPWWVADDVQPSATASGPDEDAWRLPSGWPVAGPSPGWVEPESLLPTWLSEETWQPPVLWLASLPPLAWIDEDVWPVRVEEENAPALPLPQSQVPALWRGDTDEVVVPLTVVDDEGWQAPRQWGASSSIAGVGNDGDVLPIVAVPVRDEDVWGCPVIWGMPPQPPSWSDNDALAAPGIGGRDDDAWQAPVLWETPTRLAPWGEADGVIAPLLVTLEEPGWAGPIVWVWCSPPFLGIEDGSLPAPAPVPTPDADAWQGVRVWEPPSTGTVLWDTEGLPVGWLADEAWQSPLLWPSNARGLGASDPDALALVLVALVEDPWHAAEIWSVVPPSQSFWVDEDVAAVACGYDDDGFVARTVWTWPWVPPCWGETPAWASGPLLLPPRAILAVAGTLTASHGTADALRPASGGRTDVLVP
jgi:hypothetical protein